RRATSGSTMLRKRGVAVCEVTRKTYKRLASTQRTGDRARGGTAVGQLDGKVAMVTGGARGQGRAHAVALAMEGADVGLCDAPGQLTSAPYQLGSEADLAETARLVEEQGCRAVAVPTDVRDPRRVEAATAQITELLGPVDILV